VAVRVEDVVGREAEIASVHAFLERAATGPAFLLIDGDAGIGKTTLWEVGLGAAAGARRLVSRPSESEAKLSYSALGDLVGAAFDEARAHLPPPQRHALDVALLRRGTGGERPDHRAVSLGFLGVLRRLAADRSVLVAVEDVQWLDGPTSRVLGFALRRLEDEAVGFLATRRNGAAGSLAALEIDRPPTAERLERIALGPLGTGAIQHLLRSRVNAALSRRTIRRIYDASFGNPFAALELANELQRRGVVEPDPGAPLPVSPDAESLVRGRLARLPARTRRALLAASALSSPTLALIGRATEGLAGAAPDLDPAIRAGVVEVDGERILFTHPLLASATYQQAPATDRRAMHRRLAGLVADPEEAARHVALGAEGPDPAAAAELDRAARLADERGAPDSAAELLELAAGLTPPERTRAILRRTIDAGAEHMAAGDRERARDLLARSADSAPPGPERCRAYRLLGEMKATGDSFPEAVRLLSTALQDTGDDPGLRAPVELDLAYAVASGGDIAGARPHADAALELAKQVGEQALLAESTSVAAVVDFLLGARVRENALRWAVAIEDPRRRIRMALRPAFNLGFVLTLAGRLEEARPALNAVLQRSAEIGEEGELALPTFFLVLVECASGNLQTAARYVEEGETASRRVGEPWAIGMSLAASSLLHAYTGPADRAREEIGAATALYREMGWTVGLAWGAWLLGLIALSEGDHAGAHGALEPLVDRELTTGVVAPAPPVVPDAVESLLGVGDLDRARRLVALLPGSGRAPMDAMVLRCRGMVEAAGGSIDAGIRTLGNAARRYDLAGRPFDAAGGRRTLHGARRRAVGRAGRRGARSGRRARWRPWRPDRERGEGGASGGGGKDQPGDRRRAPSVGPHGGEPPVVGLPQARRAIANGARRDGPVGPLRRRRRAPGSGTQPGMMRIASTMRSNAKPARRLASSTALRSGASNRHRQVRSSGRNVDQRYRTGRPSALSPLAAAAAAAVIAGRAASSDAGTYRSTRKTGICASDARRDELTHRHGGAPDVLDLGQRGSRHVGEHDRDAELAHPDAERGVPLAAPSGRVPEAGDLLGAAGLRGLREGLEPLPVRGAREDRQGQRDAALVREELAVGLTRPLTLVGGVRVEERRIAETRRRLGLGVRQEGRAPVVPSAGVGIRASVGPFLRSGHPGPTTIRRFGHRRRPARRARLWRRRR